jgi:hypothetical protein
LGDQFWRIVAAKKLRNSNPEYTTLGRPFALRAAQPIQFMPILPALAGRETSKRKEKTACFPGFSCSQRSICVSPLTQIGPRIAD